MGTTGGREIYFFQFNERTACSSTKDSPLHSKFCVYKDILKESLLDDDFFKDEDHSPGRDYFQPSSSPSFKITKLFGARCALYRMDTTPQAHHTLGTPPHPRHTTSLASPTLSLLLLGEGKGSGEANVYYLCNRTFSFAHV